MRAFVALIMVCIAAGLLAPAAWAEADGVFFPPGTWAGGTSTSADAGPDGFYEDWFGGHPAALQEAPLWSAPEAAGEDDVIRLLFLPTFNRPSVLRLTKTDTGDYLYEFRQSDGAGGYDPGQLAVQDRGRLTRNQADRLEALLADVQPLALDTDISASSQPLEGRLMVGACADGTQTVLEVRMSAKYHAITRHECAMPKDSPLRQLIWFFNDISKGRMIAKDTF